MKQNRTQRREALLLRLAVMMQVQCTAFLRYCVIYFLWWSFTFRSMKYNNIALNPMPFFIPPFLSKTAVGLWMVSSSPWNASAPVIESLPISCAKWPAKKRLFRKDFISYLFASRSRRNWIRRMPKGTRSIGSRTDKWWTVRWVAFDCRAFFWLRKLLQFSFDQVLINSGSQWKGTITAKGRRNLRVGYSQRLWWREMEREYACPSTLIRFALWALLLMWCHEMVGGTVLNY